MTDKAPDAYRTISEAAAELDLPAHVLRFWESRFKQIKPIKRAGGRRQYRPSDIRLLMGIRTLLYDQGYTIKGAQKFLKEHGVSAVSAIGEGEAVEPSEPVPVAERYVPEAAVQSGTNLGPVIRRLEAVKSRLDDVLAARTRD